MKLSTLMLACAMAATGSLALAADKAQTEPTLGQKAEKMGEKAVEKSREMGHKAVDAGRKVGAGFKHDAKLLADPKKLEAARAEEARTGRRAEDGAHTRTMAAAPAASPDSSTDARQRRIDEAYANWQTKQPAR